MKVHSKFVGVIKYAILTLLGVILYKAAADYALQIRGYCAVGGEVFILSLPLLYYAVSKSVKDTVEESKHDWNNWSDDD